MERSLSLNSEFKRQKEADRGFGCKYSQFRESGPTNVDGLQENGRITAKLSTQSKGSGR